MALPVTVEDVAARWRPLSGAERSVAVALLDDAEALILARVPDLVTRLSAGVVSEGIVRAVASAVVLRVLRNPEGKLQETIDDYSYRRADGVSSGALYLTDDELLLLTGATATSTSSSGAFTVRPSYDPTQVVRDDLVWPVLWPGVTPVQP